MFDTHSRNVVLYCSVIWCHYRLYYAVFPKGMDVRVGHYSGFVWRHFSSFRAPILLAHFCLGGVRVNSRN